MAYGTKYKIRWESVVGDYGFIYLQKKDWIGSISYLRMKPKDFKISRGFKNWEEMISGNTCSFSIMNNKDDFFDLMELMTVTERQFRIKVLQESGSPVTLFSGFLNTDITKQKYLNKQWINLTASSYLSKLEHVYPISFDTLQHMTFIDVITEILEEIDGESPVRINCRLYAQGDTLLARQTLFNKNSLWTEAFWEDNVQRLDSLEILKQICTTFNCYIYWWDNRWYIERYDDIWREGSISYVEYQPATQYGPTSSGNAVTQTKVVEDVHDFTFAKMTQTLSIIPGYKEIEVEVDTSGSLLLSLSNMDFSEIVLQTEGIIWPENRTWVAWKKTSQDSLNWYGYGLSYRGIANGIGRLTSWEQSTQDEEPDWWYKGLATSFKMTVGEETTLAASFKYTFTTKTALDYYFLYTERDPRWKYVEITDQWELFEIEFRYWIRVSGTNTFIQYIESSNEWALVTATEETGINFVTIDGLQFDPNTRTVEVGLSIPLSEVVGLPPGEVDLTFCAISENFRWKDHSELILGPSDTPAWFGDFRFAADGEQLESDIITGTINTDFLNKKEFKLVLADNGNFNYKNGVTRGDIVQEPTVKWTDGSDGFYSLIERIFIDKFKLHNISRQKVTSTIISSDLLKPLSLYEDSKQGDKKFILTHTEHKPMDREYKITLMEYDNETVIILN